MSAFIPAIIAVATILLGYQLQRRYEQTASYAAGAVFFTGLAMLFVPTILGFEVIYLVGVFFGVAIGASILYKQRMRAIARNWTRKHGNKH
ncbi:MAG: hypothetical protein IT343_19175 [Candidatus Melainabacteria bacterium]|jgi:hypothetical protein|nr:hypothetical protein [Candidatus Melainabacteria bacterium]